MKKNFILLEILIGIFLIEIAALPFLTQPIRAFQTELKSFEELEGERLADLSFVEIQEKLFQNAIAWEALPAPGETKTFSLSPYDLQIPSLSQRQVKREFLLKCDLNREKMGMHEETYRLLKVEIRFDPPLTKKKSGAYLYKIAVKRES